METKQIYMFSLVCLFFLFGTLGFISISPPEMPGLQATSSPIYPTLAAGATEPVGIPVTAEPERGWNEILIFYGLIGVTALFLILALLNFANKSTAQHVPPNTSSSNKPHQN